jgi:hypothetical protein
VRRLALAAVLCSALAAPALVRAETVPGSAGATDSLLALGAGAQPVVAFAAANGSIVVAARAADGGWSQQTLPLAAQSAPPALVGLQAGRTGSVLLLEATDGSRITLAEQQPSGWRVRTVATAPKGGTLGFGGLAVGADGRPLVAYAYLLSNRKSYLRLVHEDAKGRLVGEAVTRKGFPPSTDLPTVSPLVLASGAVRVVEAYSGATIEWSRTRSGKDWTGQFIYANSLAAPAGVLQAFADPAGGTWSAWTELFPDYGESQLVLAQNLNGQRTTILDHHAFLVTLVRTPAGPEVAADDYVELQGGRTVFAGLVLDAQGGSVELDGNLEGYAVEPGGARDYLLLDGAGVEWYRSPTVPTAHVDLSASVSGAAFTLAGKVANGALPATGSVEIFRETGVGPELLATLPLAADGTFSLTDTPPSRPLTYRAVYVDANGVPVSSLVRTALGA